MSKKILVTGKVSDAKMFINSFKAKDFKVVVVSSDPVPEAVATKAYICDYDIAEPGSGFLVGGDIRHTSMEAIDTLIHIADLDLTSSEQGNYLVSFIEEVSSKGILSDKLNILILSQEVDVAKNFKQSSEGRSIASHCRDSLRGTADKVFSIVYERDQSRWCGDAINYILEGKDKVEAVDFILSSGALFRNSTFVPSYIESFGDTAFDYSSAKSQTRDPIKAIVESNLFGSKSLAKEMYKPEQDIDDASFISESAAKKIKE